MKKMSFEEFLEGASVCGHIGFATGEFSHAVTFPDGHTQYIFGCEDADEAIAYGYYRIYLLDRC